MNRPSGPVRVTRALFERHKDRMVKVLIPTVLRRFDSYCPGHRALHFAGDKHLGVGLLITRPEPTRADLQAQGLSPEDIAANDLVEAEYVRMGDWVIYAAPNEYTNPYVIDVRAGSDARKLARTFKDQGRAILATIRSDWADELRLQMPSVNCARCQEPCALFLVSNDEWARVGPQWLREVLCRDCYDAVIAVDGRA